MYKKGHLSSDKIKRLEAIGFIWEVLEENLKRDFEKLGFIRKAQVLLMQLQHIRQRKGTLLVVGKILKEVNILKRIYL